MKQNKAAWICILLGLVFIGLGIWREEVAVLFVKSVNICLECIGIG